VLHCIALIFRQLVGSSLAILLVLFGSQISCVKVVQATTVDQLHKVLISQNSSLHEKVTSLEVQTKEFHRHSLIHQLSDGKVVPFEIPTKQDNQGNTKAGQD
jgi:hypothetical protein